MEKLFLSLLNLLYIFIDKSYALKCGEQEIKNCLECGNGDKLDTCMKCEEKYFLFFHNLTCLACDDANYGQIGWGGNCDGSRYITDGVVYCDKDCKEGYYNIEGICYKCSEVCPGCKKCKNDDKFICEECINNEYNLDKNFSLCVHCSLPNCIKCHFEENGSQICDNCSSGFYLSNGLCIECKYVEISNGICQVCSDNENDYTSRNCFCDHPFILVNNSACVSCPEKCLKCQYNNITKKIECLKCNSGYIINSEKECTSCGEGCEYCFLNNGLEPICKACYSRIQLTEDKKCLLCPKNCNICYLDKNNIINCNECYEGYSLNKDGICEKCPYGCISCFTNEIGDKSCDKCADNFTIGLDGKCIECSNISEIGGPLCEKCGYNSKTKKYECYQCKKYYSNIFVYDLYAYINNTFQCLNSIFSNDSSLYGCLLANYNEEKKQYECIKCVEHFGLVYIINDKRCKNKNEIKLNYCLEAENLGTIENPKYSCIKCESNSFVIKEVVNIIQVNKLNLLYYPSL